MRSLPNGWNIFLAKLGFKRKKRKCGQRDPQRRCLGFEFLEGRRMLATYTVNTPVDELDLSVTDGDISLRDAVLAANAGDTINFNQGVMNGETINLLASLGDIDIDETLTIDASMLSEGLTIDAGHQNFRIFNITDTSGGADTPQVTLKGLKLTGGDASGSGASGRGGAIRSNTMLSIINSVFEDNEASSAGGAIWISVALTAGTVGDFASNLAFCNAVRGHFSLLAGHGPARRG